MIKNKNIKVILGIVAFLLALFLMYIVLKAVDDRQSEWDDYDETEYEEAEIIFDDTIYELLYPVKSYLIMGTDGSGNEDVKGEEYQGSMADFLMLLVVDQKEKKYGFLEINRDTIAEIPMMDHKGNISGYSDLMLCTAHWYGGSKRMSCMNTVDAVSCFLGNVPINGYLAIPMDHISDINRILGGVTVTLEDDFSAEDPAMKIGETLKLTDEQAAIYLRGRMSVGDGENTSRMRRQKVYLDAAFEQIKEQNAADTEFVAKAYKQVMEYATSDIDMKVINKLAQNMEEYESLGILRIDGETKRGDTFGDGEEHSEFYADMDSVREAVMQLYPLQNTGESYE